MVVQLFSVKDARAGLFGPPLIGINIPMMTRRIIDVMRESQHPWSLHPGDYVLFQLGEFDDLTGAITLLDAPLSIVVLDQLKESF